MKKAASGGAPAFPTSFVPPPPLGKPPEPDLNKPWLNYLRKLHVPLRRAWSSFLENCRLRLPPTNPLNNPKLSVTATLVLTRKGKLHSARLVKKSGNADFDAAAIEVVRDSAPYVPAPVGLVSDDGYVHVTWLFARDVRQAGVATASVRRIKWPIERALGKFLSLGDRYTATARLATELERVNLDDAAQAKRFLRYGDRLGHAVILAALAGDETELRRAAVDAVAAARLAAALPQVRKLARTSPDPDVRAKAVRALGRLGDTVSVGLLRDILAGKVGPAQRVSTTVAAARALAALGKAHDANTRIAAWLGSRSKAQRRIALQVLADYGVPDTVPALAALLRGGAGRGDKTAACLALGRSALGPQRKRAMRALERGLRQPDAGIRAACARGAAVAAKAGVKSRSVYWAVVNRMKDRDNHVRAAAILAAARLEPRRFVQALYLVARERSPRVLAALAEGLARVPGKLAYARLRSLARNGSARVRRAAASSLMVRTEPGARRALAKLLDDPDAGVRRAALAVVDDEAVLKKLLNAKPAELRAAALSRLVQARGRAKTLPTLLRRLLAAKGQLIEQVRLAKAWLAPKA